LLWVLSKALWEMKDLSSSAFCWLRFFSAQTCWAFAASTSACRAATRACTSVMSTRASTCPCCTLSPSRTATATSSPATFALTVASLNGISDPVSGSVRSRPAGETMTKSSCRNSATGVVAAAGAGLGVSCLPRSAA